MNLFSTTCAISAFMSVAFILPAAQDSVSAKAHVSWIECFKQYSWPYGHNILLDPNVRETSSGNNWTSLHVAVSHGYPKVAKALLENGAAIVKDAKAQFPFELPLHEGALERAHEQMRAQHLVKAVWQFPMVHLHRFKWPATDVLATPNCLIVQDEINSITPLHFAIFAVDFSMTQALLKRGALPLKDSQGRFPHDVPLNWGLTVTYKRAKALVRTVYKELNSMHVLVRDYNSATIIKLAQADPASVNAYDVSKRTPLMHLVIAHDCQMEHGDEALLATVNALLEQSAKTDSVDSFGKRAYDYLMESDKESAARKEVLQLLR